MREGRDLNESVDLFLCDPSYNVQDQQDLKNSTHDVFYAKVIEAFCDFVEHSLMCEGRGHIVSSAVQFVSWWRRFGACTEEMKDFVGKPKVFEMAYTRLLCRSEHDSFLQDPGLGLHGTWMRRNKQFSSGLMY